MMESNRTRELVTGLFVLLGFAALLFLATQTTDLDQYIDDAGYRITARFSDVAGLKVRAPVTLAGVNVGRVESIQFDNARLDAVVVMRIRTEFNQIPDDSDAAIITAGLLGSKYIGIGPGGSDTYFADGSEVEITQSAVVLEDLIGKFMFSSSGQGDTQTK